MPLPDSLISATVSLSCLRSIAQAIVTDGRNSDIIGIAGDWIIMGNSAEGWPVPVGAIGLEDGVWHPCRPVYAEDGTLGHVRVDVGNTIQTCVIVCGGGR